MVGSRDPSQATPTLQVVRALTVTLHRQWLTVRWAGPPKTEQQKWTVRCLRDIVLLLHCLSQKDKLFTVHCVDVLHQYDQVMPGVSMLIRGLPDVTDCEGKPPSGLPPAVSQRLTGFKHLPLPLLALAHSPAFLLWFSELSRLVFTHLLSQPGSHNFPETTPSDSPI